MSLSLNLKRRPNAPLNQFFEQVFASWGRRNFRIHKKEIVFFTSFNLDLGPPSKVTKLIKKARKTKILFLKDEHFHPNKEIRDRIKSDWNRQEFALKPPEKRKQPKLGFNKILKALDPSNEISTAFKIPSKNVTYNLKTKAPLIVTGKIIREDFGTPVKIIINEEKKIINCSCMNFEKLFADRDKFCCHIIKLVLMIRRDIPKTTIKFLEQFWVDFARWSLTSSSS